MMGGETRPSSQEESVAVGKRGDGQLEVSRYRSSLEPVGLDYPVVAVKFSATKPTELPRLGKKVALCGMLKEAQESGAFYASKDEQGCAPGSFVLGQIAHDRVMESGRIGPSIGVYESVEANKRIYSEMTRFPEGTARYTFFAPLDELTFAPDLLIVTATPSQAEIILRAHGWRTGAAWEMRGTTVLGCACLYALPYFTGKMNILISGLHHGMRARGFFPEGLLLMAIPSPLVPEIIDNLAVMADRGLIDLPQYHWGKDYHEQYMRDLAGRLAKEPDLEDQDG